MSLLFALACESWLGWVALASINLWITVPHHFGTWCRTYGLTEDWTRFRSRVILGPIIILALVIAGFRWAPLTVFLVTMLWDHQHSVMQQHGLARIYDLKARTGDAGTGRLDLWLNIVLFVNMLATVPLWTEIWVQQLFTWKFPVSSGFVRAIQAVSYAGTALFLIYYVTRVAASLGRGQKINPMKYIFLAASYALWYTAGWHTNSLLVYGIAHRMMHGLQYLVIVYWFLEKKQANNGQKPWMLPGLNIWSFVLVGMLYAFLFQMVLLRPVGDFGFGLLGRGWAIGDAIPMSASRLDMYGATIVNATALVHYYFDSFIWKIRDQKTQQGLS
jgi:hypothetical protein